jgi:Cu(I)/Ag(I) efflux system membrane fusion protein
VFVEESEGRFRPRLVKIGVRAAGVVEIVEGLEVGETVVTSGNFLIAAESRLKGGMQQW